MADGARYPRALFLGASVVSFALLMGDAAVAQTADTQETGRPSERKKQAKRKPAKPQAEQQAAAPVLNAYAQVGRAPVQSLDTITVAASKTEERAIDALAPVSVVTLEQIQGLQPNRLVDIFYNVPGVSFQDRGDDPATVDQHPRPAGFRPRRGRGRRRAAELPAHRPQRQRLVLPRSRTDRRRRYRARPDREHLRLRRDRRRGFVPHQGHQRRRAPGRALGRRP